MLTGLCNLTGFAGVALLEALETKKIGNTLFAHFIVPNGFPKLVLIDKDSLFGNVLKTMLDELSIAYKEVSPEQHEGILCERFHRYLNKVQKIQGLEMRDHKPWMLNSLFATYAWNAGPIKSIGVTL